ncbi:MAG TPA: hypothetical protein VHO29_09590 [Marmoricola sp.]|nr:hypothetical protein [Marmoricola sp.]
MRMRVERERWACVVPWTAGTVLGWFAVGLAHHIGEARTAGLFGLAGVALGLCWYRLYPRPLLERIELVGIAVLAASLLSLVFGGTVSHPTVRSMIGVGVLAGLILAESWRPGEEWARQRRTSLTSSATMRELR